VREQAEGEVPVQGWGILDRAAAYTLDYLSEDMEDNPVEDNPVVDNQLVDNQPVDRD